MKELHLASPKSHQLGLVVSPHLNLDLSHKSLEAKPSDALRIGHIQSHIKLASSGDIVQISKQWDFVHSQNLV